MLDKDYLARRRQELGLDRYDTLQRVQAWLDQQYPGNSRAISLNHGVLKVVTPNASVSSELRMRQGEIRQLVIKEELSRIQIVIGTIS